MIIKCRETDIGTQWVSWLENVILPAHKNTSFLVAIKSSCPITLSVMVRFFYIVELVLVQNMHEIFDTGRKTTDQSKTHWVFFFTH
jgi:hypothetical protein